MAIITSHKAETRVGTLLVIDILYWQNLTIISTSNVYSLTIFVTVSYYGIEAKFF